MTKTPKTAAKIPAWLALSFPNEGSKSPVCPKGVVPDDPEIRGIRGKNPRFLKNDQSIPKKNPGKLIVQKIGDGSELLNIEISFEWKVGDNIIDDVFFQVCKAQRSTFSRFQKSQACWV